MANFGGLAGKAGEIRAAWREGAGIGGRMGASAKRAGDFAGGWGVC